MRTIKKEVFDQAVVVRRCAYLPPVVVAAAAAVVVVSSLSLYSPREVAIHCGPPRGLSGSLPLTWVSRRHVFLARQPLRLYHEPPGFPSFLWWWWPHGGEASPGGGGRGGGFSQHLSLCGFLAWLVPCSC